MGKMKTALMIVIIVAIVAIAGSLLYYYVFFRPGVQQETAKKSTANTTAVIVNTVDDYTTRMDEYITFYDECDNLRSKYNDINKSPGDNYSNSKTNVERISYAKILLDNYQKYYKEALDIKVPDSAKEAYKYYLEWINQNKISLSCLIDYDTSGSNEAQDKATTEFAKFINELKRIVGDFNKEAERLGLPKPFPNTFPNK
ncbi:MAG: hypothetical protein NTV16_01155 [Actinobacteria bacterium]|nr:hypothetical protein [Actinomycetota bacterium]